MWFCRGLFEKDKLVFSFMMCVEIMRTAKLISTDDWNFFLRGGGSMEKVRPPKPDLPWLSMHSWIAADDLHHLIPDFMGIINDLTKTPCWVTIGDVTVSANPKSDPGYGPMPSEPPPRKPPNEEEEGEKKEQKYDGAIKGHWDKRLTNFQKLIFVKAFAEDRVVQCVTEFVRDSMGRMFVEPPATDLPTLYEDMNNITPLVFVLSTGSDPMGAFLRFAKERNYLERIQSISLGQGQGPVAEKLILAAIKSGDWVFLQNCHLAASWMLPLEEMVKEIAEKPEEINEDYRLFLSSMPSKCFPVSVLQNSVKVTNEPPKGLRSNLKRGFAEITNTFFEDHVLGQDWRRVIFGLSFFHGIILERKKFGPLGWNIRYEFSDSDRECALLNLQMFCADGYIPWDALIYITGEITYGGRVTDAWDQRCLRTVLKTFFQPKTLAEDYKFSNSGTCTCI